jgi:TRAP-type C4-dicarboxylate transport system substrate-binding protein
MLGTINRRRFLKASAGGVAISLSAPYVSLQAAPLTMRFAHFGAEDHPSNTAAKQFAANVEERTGGAIKINIFPNNALGGPPEQAQQIKLGTIDMGLPTQGQLDKYNTALAPRSCLSSGTARSTPSAFSTVRLWTGLRPSR